MDWTVITPSCIEGLGCRTHDHANAVGSAIGSGCTPVLSAPDSDRSSSSVSRVLDSHFHALLRLEVEHRCWFTGWSSAPRNGRTSRPVLGKRLRGSVGGQGGRLALPGMARASDLPPVKVSGLVAYGECGLGQLLSPGALTRTVPPGSGTRDIVYIARIVEMCPPSKVQAHGGVRPSPGQARCFPVPVGFQRQFVGIER